MGEWSSAVTNLGPDAPIVDHFLRAIDPRGGVIDLEELRRLEVGFVEAAARFSTLHGISWDAWIDVGVSPALLERAHLRRD